MEEIDLNTIKKRSVHGVLALASRTFILQVISLLATFALTVFLKPEEYGIFFVVSAVVNFLVYFSDIGLAAALIQKRETLDGDDLKTTFTIQQLLVVFLVILSLSLSGVIAGFYGLSSPGLWLLRALIFSFFLSSLKTIPSIILERQLKFDKLIIPAIVENIFFYGVAVVLAANSFGIASFTYAVLARGLSGLVVLYLLAPWKPVVGIAPASAKKLLSFGLPFQANSILALVKDDLLTVFLGKVLTFSAVGYIGWGQKWAFFPLRFFMDSVIKVTFPAMSRLQHDKILLGKAIERSIYFISITVFPVLTGLFLVAPYFVSFFPKYEKWQPALVALTFFCVNAIFSSISTVLTNALNAIGKIKITLRLMIGWTCLTWILTLIFLRIFGFNGVPIASALVAATLPVTVIIAKKAVSFSFWENIRDGILATASMAIVFYALALLISNLLTLAVVIAVSAVAYIIFLFVIAGSKLKNYYNIINLWQNQKSQ